MKKLKKILLINWLYFSKEIIEVGDINFLTGKNGAGKSTTMKMLLGLTAPTKGSFTIDGSSFWVIGLPFSKRSALSSKRRLSTQT